jgi:K+-sensing histidine kinase KdpD
LRKEGRDVVLGFIETHRRADTVAQVGDLERLPLREIEYRGRYARRDEPRWNSSSEPRVHDCR